MKLSRAVAACAAAITLCLTVTSCGASGTGSNAASFTTSAKGTLKAWGFDNADDVGKARLAYAGSKLHGVSITIDQTPFDAQKFTTRLASGSVPDVVQMDSQFVATYAAQGLIMPLDKCYSAHSVDPKQRYYSQVTDDVTWKGHIWAVPQFYQPPAIMLNTRVMSQAGVGASQLDTSKPDQLIAAAKKMYTASGGNPTRLGFDPVATGQTALWIVGSGGQLTDGNGKPTLSDKRNAAGIDYLKKILDAQGGYAKVKSFSDAFDTFGDKNPFATDQVGAQVDNQWYVDVLSPYVKKVQLSAVPFRDPNGNPFTLASGSSFVIPTGAKNADAGCAWALSLTSLPAWQAAAKARAATLAKTPGAINTGLFTGSPDADKWIRTTYVKPSGNTGFDQTIAAFYGVVSHGKSLGASPAGQQIQTELQNALTSVLLGQKSTQKALDDAQASAIRAYDQAIKSK
jgi:multiple sugar transport system substrate-binding protein